MRVMQARYDRAVRSAVIAASLVLALSAVPALAESPEVASAAGTYDGSQTEMAAWLELREDGRYQYLVSYGSVDEFSAGTWVRQDQGIVLTSDAANAPRFEMLGAEPGTGPGDALTIRLEGAGNMPLPLFSAVVERADGTGFTADFSEAGLAIPAKEDEQAISVSLALPMFEVRGEPVTITPTAGNTVYFAFHANDLGFKPFDHALLPESEGAFMLERYGREIAFRKVEF